MRRLFTSIKFLLAQPLSNSIFVISAIISIIAVTYLIMIISYPFLVGFTFNDIEMSNYTGTDKLAIIGHFEMIAHLIKNYIFYQCINAWLWASVLLFDFSFAGELALVLEIIDSALFDIVFFVLMFLKVFSEK